MLGIIIKCCLLILTNLCIYSPARADNTPSKVLKMAVTGLPGLEELERNFGPFQESLNKLSGLKIELYPISSRTIIVHSLMSKNVDLVLFGPAEYVITASKTKIKPIAALSRTDYFSSIVTMSNSDVSKLSDLKNKKLGVGDFGSTAYHLTPLQMIKDAGLDPLSDLKVINTAKHVGWESLKRGSIDALGIKYEQFVNFRAKETQHSAVDFRVIARSPDLPNDLLVAGEHVDPKIDERLKLVLKHNSKELIAAILKGIGNDKYQDMKFITHIKDSDYNVVREMFKTVGYPEFSKRL